MLLEQLLNIECDDAAIAGKVFKHNEDYTPLLEATARILRFNYERAKNDPRPRALVLGRWLHPRTGNKLVAAINLNYLSQEELEQLNTYLPKIMKPDSLKVRWWTGYSILPQIWVKAYRQYDERFIHSVGSADILPATQDYETPEHPGEPKVAPDVANQIQKLKEIEAQQQEEPPKEPSKKRSLTRLTKDTLKRIANLIKTKLFKNRKKEQSKQRADDAENIEREHEAEVDAEAEDLEQIEREKAAEEADELKKTEEEQTESFANKLDVVIESIIKPRALQWHSYQNYIHWHTPEKFFEHQPGLRGRVIDYTTGTKLVAIYNILEDTLIVDLVDQPVEMLAESGWDWRNTIRIVLDQTLSIEYDTPNGRNIFEERIKKHQLWNVIQEVADSQ